MIVNTDDLIFRAGIATRIFVSHGNIRRFLRQGESFDDLLMALLQRVQVLRSHVIVPKQSLWLLLVGVLYTFQQKCTQVRLNLPV